jgi:GT2 family glycosyltransferase
VGYVEKRFPWVKVLALDKNYGYTGGNNRGVKFAKGDFVVFLNNDTEVDKEWLRELVNVALLDDKIAICGSKVFFMKEKGHTQYAGGFLNLVGGTLFYPFHGHNPQRDFYLVGSICGASFLIRKKSFEILDGFDEDFFMYSDENDLCIRAWIYGYRVAYVPCSVVYHFAGGSSVGSEGKPKLKNMFGARLTSPLDVYHGNKNSIASIVKNFEFKTALIGAVSSFFYYTLQLLLLLKKADSNGIVLLSKAVFWPVKNLKKIWKKRLVIQKNRKLSDQKLIDAKLLISLTDTLRLVIKLRYYSNNIKQ